MNNSLNEYFQFNFELNNLLARFNVKMNNQNVSSTPRMDGLMVSYLKPIYQRFWNYRILATFGIFWQLLSTIGRLWQLLATFGIFWQLLADCGNFWQLSTNVGTRSSAEGTADGICGAKGEDDLNGGPTCSSFYYLTTPIAVVGLKSVRLKKKEGKGNIQEKVCHGHGIA